MPAQKQSASEPPAESGRRRSGRISSSGTKSKYFEPDSDEETDVLSSAPPKPSNGSGRKRGRPPKNAKSPVTSRSKRPKLESDDDDDDEYAEGKSEAEPEEDDDEDDEDDENAPPRVTITPLAKLRETGGVPYEDDRLHKNTLLFLKDLKANNKRTWLKSNDKEFRRAQSDWHTYVETLTPKIISADPTIPELPVKDVVMRIYRDIRFSHDPTPYRPFFSAAFSRTGRKGPYACYYVHCEPGGASFFGGGLYMPDAGSLAKLRASIDRRPERWRAALGEEALRRVFWGGVKKGDVEGCVRAFCRGNREGALKTKPKGFTADHRDIELLKLRNFTVDRKVLSDDMFTAPDSQQQIADLVRAMVGFVSFLNDIVMPDRDSSSDEDEEDDDDEEEDQEEEEEAEE